VRRRHQKTLKKFHVFDKNFTKREIRNVHHVVFSHMLAMQFGCELRRSALSAGHPTGIAKISGGIIKDSNMIGECYDWGSSLKT